MGLLDDAIREHLELKRRHGADPEEVQRQEREALGASQQRAEFAQPEGEGEDAPEDAAPDEAGAEAPDEAQPEPPPEPEPERDAEAAAPEPPIGQEEDPWDVEELADTPPGADEEAEPAAAPPEEIVRPDDEEPPAAEDVLEETPDFLSETPEHERLWFEQKPPRDFDWDK